VTSACSGADTIHPNNAYQLANQRRAELIAEAAHQRLLRAAEQAGAGLRSRRRIVRWWWRISLPGQALAE